MSESFIDIKDDSIAIGFSFEKIDTENRTVEGYATLDNVDKAGEIVDFNASKDAFKSWLGNIREMHGTKAVGKALDFQDRLQEVDGKTYNGIWVKAYISKGAEDTWEKILDGTLKGFSVGGRVLEKRPEVVKNDGIFDSRHINRITKYMLSELSVVDNPANPLALFAGAGSGVSKMSLVKFADGNIEKSDALADELIVYYCETCDVAKATPREGSNACVLCDATMENIGTSMEVPTAEDVEKMVVEKRQFTADERKRLATSGAALADGSYPIANVQDLRNAIQSVGRAKDRAAVMAHIMTRALALGAINLVPDDWKKSLEKVTNYAYTEFYDNFLSEDDDPQEPHPEVVEVNPKLVQEVSLPGTVPAQVGKAEEMTNLQLNTINDSNIMNLLSQLLEAVNKRQSETAEQVVTPVGGGDSAELDKESLTGILDVLKAAFANVEEMISKFTVTSLNSEKSEDVTVATTTSLPAPQATEPLQIEGSNGVDTGLPAPDASNVEPHSPMLGKGEDATPEVVKTTESDDVLTKAVVSEELTKVTSKLDEAFKGFNDKIVSLEERVEKISSGGAMKKSAEVNDVEDLKKNENTFWSGSFRPTPYDN